MAPEKAKPAISLLVISHVIISTQTSFASVINTFMWELIEIAIGDDSAQEKLLHILTRNVNKLSVFFQTTDFCGNYGIVKLNLDIHNRSTNKLSFQILLAVINSRNIVQLFNNFESLKCLEIQFFKTITAPSYSKICVTISTINHPWSTRLPS